MLDNLEGIVIKQDNSLTLDDTIDVYMRSSLTRPTDDSTRIETMLKNINFTVVARKQTKIIGVVQAMTDFSFSCFISTVCVDDNYRNHGIGSRMIDVVFDKVGPGVTVVTV